jgi:hypothetical protein
MNPLSVPELPTLDPQALAVAVRAVIGRQAADVAAPSVGPRSLSGRLPPSTRLESCAEQFSMDSPEDAEAARYFSALLEASYLVAAADGLAAAEREALCDLIVHTTGRAVDALALERLFERFDEALDREGLAQRLTSVAARFEDFMAREEAMSFTALVAISDGELGEREALALTALGARFDFSVGEVQAVLDQVAFDLKHALQELPQAPAGPDAPPGGGGPA